VLAQSFQDFELLIADDGSTDETEALASALAGPVRYLRYEHTGSPDLLRNYASKEARGEWVAFLDDDDLWHEEKLERQMALLSERPSAGWSYGNVSLLQPDGTLSLPVLTRTQLEPASVFDELLKGCFVHPSTGIIRATLLEKLNGFDVESLPYGDYDLWLRAAYTSEATALDAPLVFVRQYTRGISQQRTLLHYQIAAQVIGKARRSMKLNRRQRVITRRALARLHAHIGLMQLDDDPGSARPNLLQSLRYNPFTYRPWVALLHAYRA
jgi:glycosyltransferase involved in cell wall biosynthesis